MAEKLCTLRTKGGGGGAKYTETVLWTNSSPTSSFAPQTITLSDDINNYEYIGVKFNTDTKGTTPSTAIMSVTDYKKGVNTGTSGRRDVLSIASQISTEGSYYSRRVSYVSDTSANISAAKLYGSSTTSNTDVIPIQVVGIKVALPPSVGNVKTGTFTVASGVTDTITCGFRPKKIYIYNLVGTTSMLVNIYDENVSSTYTIGAYMSSSSTNGCNSHALGGGDTGVIQSITDTGFTFKGSRVMSTLYYTAIG